MSKIAVSYGQKDCLNYRLHQVWILLYMYVYIHIYIYIVYSIYRVDQHCCSGKKKTQDDVYSSKKNSGTNRNILFWFTSVASGSGHTKTKKKKQEEKSFINTSLPVELFKINVPSSAFTVNSEFIKFCNVVTW